MSAQRPLVSVLLPVRNGGPLLGLALQSLLAQTWRDFEVLVLDDGSSDGSAALAGSFNDARIKVVSDGQAQGLAARLNQGVALAQGDFIARMDADDISLPARLERQLAFLRGHPDVDLVGCRAAVFRASGEVLGLLPFAAMHEALCARPWHTIALPHPTWMGRRAWFQGHPYRVPEVVRAEDQELLLRACRDSRYACLPEVLLGYRLGDADLRKTLAARRSLLQAQLRLFASRGQWGHAARACVCGALKALRDLGARAVGRSGYRVEAGDAALDEGVRKALRTALGARQDASKAVAR
ncbi:MAG TPA: glycosyltransferase family A protein [Ramlibacter sp.]|nr:glycosyltransferase family A protein [Ramlibacter sp.]